MDYSQALDRLLNGVPHFSRAGRAALRPGLENIHALLNAVDVNPDSFKVIHVAGTNGKGSYCHAITQVLMENDHSVGTFTSPHLVDFRERILLNGELMPREAVVEFVELSWPHIEKLEASFFEVMTLMAFWYFDRVHPDFVVLETGLGGRLDCTNVVSSPLLTVITSIGLDHTDILGEDIPTIAKEKAGIAKGGTPCLSSVAQQDAKEVVRARCEELGAPLVQIEPEDTPSRTTLKLVESSCEILAKHHRIQLEYPSDLRLDTQRIPHLRGRFERLSERLVFDVAHNPDAVRALVSRFRAEEEETPLVLVAFSNDKDIEGVSGQIPKEWLVICTSCPSERIMDAAVLRDRMLSQGLNVIATENDPKQALELAMARPESMVLAFGTFHLYEWLSA